MSMSSDQATEAAMFLKIYNEAIDTVRESAVRLKENEAVESFGKRITRVYNNKVFRRLCDPKDTLLDANNTEKYTTLVKEVRSFQFSHYLFSKFLPELMVYEGDGQALTQYLQERTYKLKEYAQQ